MRLSYVRDYRLDRDLNRARLVVEMYYLPALSNNRYKRASGAVRPEVKDWMAQLGFIARLAIQGVAFLPPVDVTLDGYFADGRQPDIHNLHKCVCDGLKQGLGVDDKHYRVHDGICKVVDQAVVYHAQEGT